MGRKTEMSKETHTKQSFDSKFSQNEKLAWNFLDYYLSTLTTKGLENAFEKFCIRIVEEEICPNLLPHTGPTGGGDSKVDSETYPVSEMIYENWYYGYDKRAASERWAFAISAKNDWRAKIKSDVEKIAKVNQNEKRGYTKIFFMSNQCVPDKKRAVTEDELRNIYELDIRILDRTWLLERALKNERNIDITIECFGLSNILGLHKKLEVYIANSQYVDCFRETLFLHKRKGETRVNLINLFVMPKYKEHVLVDLDDAENDLENRISRFVRCDSQVMIIEGNAGCGKSSLIGWMNYHAFLNDEISKHVFKDRTLVTVRLRDLDRDVINSTGGLMIAILQYMNLENVDDLESTFPKALMLLDGFDELCMIEGISNPEQLISDVLHRSLNDFKWIITSRPKYISGKISASCHFITLQHFDSEQRCEWLFKYTSPKFCGQYLDSNIQNYIENIDDWADSVICDTPMTLYMLAAKETSAEIIKNSWKLYHHIFYNELSETEYNQMFHDSNRNYAHDIIHYRDIIYRINEEIAYKMYCSRNNKFYLSSYELREIIKSLSDEDIELKTESIKFLVEHCYGLCSYWKARSDDGAVEFYHNNIRDFFLCEKIFRELNALYQSNNQIANHPNEMIDMLSKKFCSVFKYNSLETMVCQFILLRTFDEIDSGCIEFPVLEVKNPFLPDIFENMLEDGALYNNLNSKNPIKTIINILTCVAQIYRHIYEPFLQENEVIKWWRSHEKINNTGLLKYVFASIFRQVPVTSSEGYILNMASKGDFSSIDFSGYDLRNIGFQNSNLVEAKFIDAILCGCDFSSAKLMNADFTNADIHYACLGNATMESCILTGADLRGTELPDNSYSLNQKEQIEKIKSLNIIGLVI